MEVRSKGEWRFGQKVRRDAREAVALREVRRERGGALGAAKTSSGVEKRSDKARQSMEETDELVPDRKSVV